MIVNLSVSVNSIEQMHVSQSVIVRLLVACALGAVVGVERESRHKASGLRTNILISMGAALFTVMSIFLAGDASPNKGQVASNIVQGIGFLGAGLILHSANRVLGITSAATVWVVAAIGMTCGAGLYVPAIVATLIVFISLRFVGLMESRSHWKRYPMLYEVRGTDEETMFADILCALDKWKIRLNVVERDQVGVLQRVTFAVSASAVRHKQLLQELNACDATDHVACYHDEEDD